MTSAVTLESLLTLVIKDGAEVALRNFKFEDLDDTTITCIARTILYSCEELVKVLEERIAEEAEFDTDVLVTNDTEQ